MNVFRQRGAIGAVLRTIPFDIPTFDSLHLPEIIESFAHLPRGLVLVTGPTGSGKSTTLAALLDIVNRTKAVHILSVEDPIEFLYSHKRAIVNQREVGEDTKSFASALKRAFAASVFRHTRRLARPLSSLLQPTLPLLQQIWPRSVPPSFSANLRHAPPARRFWLREISSRRC